MFKETKFTLYDFFGFLLPGAVLLAALVVLHRAFFNAQQSLLLSVSAVEGWVALFIIAYFCGHLAQAFSWHVMGWLNSVCTLCGRPYAFAEPNRFYLDPDSPNHISLTLIENARARLGQLAAVDAAHMEYEDLFRSCESLVTQRGNVGDRELFIYRTGFYRGMAIAALFLLVALVLHLVRCDKPIEIPGVVQPDGCVPQLFFMALSAATVWLSFERFRMFSRYRIINTMTDCAALRTPEE